MNMGMSMGKARRVTHMNVPSPAHVHAPLPDVSSRPAPGTKTEAEASRGAQGLLKLDLAFKEGRANTVKSVNTKEDESTI